MKSISHLGSWDHAYKSDFLLCSWITHPNRQDFHSKQHRPSDSPCPPLHRIAHASHKCRLWEGAQALAYWWSNPPSIFLFRHGNVCPRIVKEASSSWPIPKVTLIPARWGKKNGGQYVLLSPSSLPTYVCRMQSVWRGTSVTSLTSGTKAHLHTQIHTIPPGLTPGGFATGMTKAVVPTSVTQMW